jgi:ABC-type multidrug transport system fused ATPase/permease subunit
MLLAPIMDIPNLFVTSKQAFASIDRENELLDFPAAPARTGAADPGRITELALDGAGFNYPGSGGVSGITVRVEAPCTIAVVGEVGSGKSTLLRMLAGQLPCESGEVRLNGLPLGDVAPTALAREVGFVPQESMLLSESVEENVRLGRRIDHERLMRALELADLPPEELSAGVDTRLGQGGSGVSGGQKQRVAIARALAGAPSLCLFDDCTAALDADLEERFWNGMRGGEGVVFVVTHREATVRRSDYVLFLHEGGLNDSGTHEELLCRNELYRLVLATGMQ